MENFHNIKIKSLQMDNGGEYISKDFVNFCTSSGITLSHSPPAIPEQLKDLIKPYLQKQEPLKKNLEFLGNIG